MDYVVQLASSSLAFGSSLQPGKPPLSLLPTLVLITTAPLYIRRCHRQSIAPALEVPDIRTTMRLVVGLGLVSVEAMLLVPGSQAYSTGFEISIFTSIVSSATAALLLGLLYAEYCEVLHLSSLVTVYVTVCAPLDACRAWGHFAQGASLFGRHANILCGLKLMMLCFCDLSGHPAYIILREVLCSVKDLLQLEAHELDADEASEDPANNFSKLWRNSEPSEHRLVRICFLATAKNILICLVPRVCLTAFLAFPLLLAWDVLVDTKGLSLHRDIFVSSVGTCAFIYLGISISRNIYLRQKDRAGLILRGMLSKELCRKALRIHNSPGNAIRLATLLDSDVRGVVHGVLAFVDTSVAVLQSLLGFYFLWKLTGLCALLLALSPIVSVIKYQFMKVQISSLLNKWTKKTKFRVSETFDFLSQLKGLKLLSLQSTVQEDVMALYSSEVRSFADYHHQAEKKRYAQSLADNIIPALALACLWAKDSLKGQSRVIAVTPTLTAVSLAMQPMRSLPENCTRILSGLQCARRLQSFLLLDEVADSSPSRSYQVRQNSPAPREETPGPSFEYLITELSSKSWLVDSCRFYQTREAARLREQDIVVRFTNAIVECLDGQRRLNGVNITIKRSEVTVIIGPAGSGKSIFLKSILGEANIFSGVLLVAERLIAYCGHEPWIQDASIRENIVGAFKFDLTWYNCVVDTCLLRLDINRLRGRDSFVVGINGAKLSLQVLYRIALARCLYARAPITLLDDIFAVLDPRSAKTIYKRIFDRSDDGFFRQLNSAVVLTTTSVDNRLAANQLLLIDEHGNAVTQNSNSGIALTNHYMSLLRRRAEHDGAQATLGGAQDLGVDLACHKEVAEEGLSLCSSYVKLLRPDLSTLPLVLLVTFALVENIPQLYLRLCANVTSGNLSFLICYSLASITSAVLPVYLNESFYPDAIVKMASKLYLSLLETVSSATLAKITSKDLGVALNGANNDFEITSTSMPFALIRLISSLLLVLTDNIVILTAARQKAIPLLCLVGAFFFVQRYFREDSRQIEYHIVESKAAINNYCTEASSGTEYIRGFGWQSDSILAVSALLQRYHVQLRAKYGVERRAKFVADLLSVFAAVTVVVSALSLPQATTTGMSLVLLVTYSKNLMHLVEDLFFFDCDLSAASRFRKFIDNTPTEPKLPDIYLPPKWPAHGDIQLINVEARYNVLKGFSSSSNSALALDQVSLNVDPGMKVGITGPKRSGKSSLFLTMHKFLDYSGSIVIDGIDISRVPHDELRTRITTVSAHGIKLSGSIRDNLTPFKGQQEDLTINDYLLYEALDQLGLWELVSAAGGYGAPMSNLYLNRQQKHLFCIARAMLQRLHTQSRVVLMDEPTTKLDTETAALAQEVMEEAFLECTVLTAAESENSLPVVEMLLGLEDGAVEFVD